MTWSPAVESNTILTKMFSTTLDAYFLNNIVTSAGNIIVLFDENDSALIFRGIIHVSLKKAV